MSDMEKSTVVAAIVADCLRKIDAGEQLDLHQLAKDHPEHAEELRAWFADDQLMQNMVADSTGTSRYVADSERKTLPPGAGDSTPASQSRFGPLPTKFGRYRVLRILGQGAMGAVYLAHDTRLGRDVALKTPKIDDSTDQEIIERFQREARSAAVLHHRNLCPVFDVGEIDGIHFLTMAYIDGIALSSLVSESKPLSERQVASIVRKLAIALQEAHSHSVMHRDLKPANIMLDRSQEPVVMDFGLAWQQETTDQSRLTSFGMLIGSPAYMSPEQVGGDPQAVTATTDIYSLGIILFELLTGQLPYQGNTIAILAQIIAPETRDVRDARPEVCPQLATICSRMMAKQSAKRFPSMQAVADALTEWMRIQKKPRQIRSAVPDGPNLESIKPETVRKDKLPPRTKRGKSRHTSDQTPDSTSQEEIPELPPAPQRRRPAKVHATKSVRPVYFWSGAAAFASLVLIAVVSLRPNNSSPDSETTVERTAASTDRTATQLDIIASGADNVSKVSANEAERFSAGPYEILTSDAWEWATPQFIGEFETDGNMDELLTDDFTTWIGALPQAGDHNEKKRRDLVQFTRQAGDTRWSEPQLLAWPINTDSHEGGGALSADGRWLAFGSDRGQKRWLEDIWICERSPDGEGWTEPIKLGPQVNKHNVWDGMPSFSPDGLTLYFASARNKNNRHSGMWVTHRKTLDGEWSEAVELTFPGPSIIGMRPIVSSDDRVLMFWSQHPGGLGEFDLYQCVRSSPNDSWSAPINLGAPVNSAGHEFLAAMSRDGTLLLFRRIPAGGKEADGHGYWSARRIRKQSRNTDFGSDSPASRSNSVSSSNSINSSGWIQLFNGSDLSGWHTVYSKSDVWRAEENGIVSRRRKSNESGVSGWLATDADFMNFELQLEYKLERGGNSGIFLRALPGKARSGANQLEIQLLDDDAPQFQGKVTDKQITGAIYDLVAASPRAGTRPKTWVKLSVRMVRSEVGVSVNGTEITKADLAQFTNEIGERFRYDKPGPIGLQWHGSRVHFRNIRARHLDATGKLLPAGSSLPHSTNPFVTPNAN